MRLRVLKTLSLFLFLFLFTACRGSIAQTLQEAARLDAEGKCEEAERIYQAALSKGSPSAALLNNAGNHYLLCNQSAQAAALFEKLLRLNPLHVNANLQLARLAAEQKQGNKALKYLARVKDSGPAAQLVRAEALHWAGHQADAAKILDALQQQAPADPRLLTLLGLTSARLTLYDRAEAAFSAALTIQPGNFDLLFNLGRAAGRAGHHERAQRALEAALKIQPGRVEVLIELGRVSAARRDFIRAVYLLAQARLKSPGNPEVLLLLARAAEEAAYYEDAAKTYDEYLLLRPGDDAVRRDRARVCGFVESRREEARQEIDGYLEKHPADPLGHYVMSQLLWWPEPQKALAHLTKAARLDPASLPIRFARAWMLQRLGQMEESLPELEAARRLDPENVRVLDLTGLAHLSLQQPAEAEKVLRHALARAPDDPEVVLHLGRAVMALHREEEAQALMEKYQKIRPQRFPGVRKYQGMIELATLSAPELRTREIERFRRDAREHPDHPEYQLHLASLLLAHGQQDEALREFQLLLTRNANSQVWEEAGSMLLTAHEYQLAREFLQRAVAERPSARLDLAIALFYQEGAESALESLDKNPAGKPTGDELLLRANLLEAAGKKAEAENMLAEGLRQTSTKPEVVRPAVLLLQRLGRKIEAMRLLEQAIPANPQDSDLPLTRAILLGLLGEFAPAEKAFREIELRWPEWDRVYLAHGILLEKSGHPTEARQKLQLARTLGAQEPALKCALARLADKSPPTEECACHAGLEQLLSPGCGR